MSTSSVDRAAVAAVIEGWAKGTGAAQLGRSWGVVHPDGMAGLVGWLIAGPVGAVLDGLGYEIVEDPSGS